MPLERVGVNTQGSIRCGFRAGAAGGAPGQGRAHCRGSGHGRARCTAAPAGSANVARSPSMLHRSSPRRFAPAARLCIRRIFETVKYSGGDSHALKACWARMEPSRRNVRCAAGTGRRYIGVARLIGGERHDPRRRSCVSCQGAFETVPQSGLDRASGFGGAGVCGKVAVRPILEGRVRKSGRPETATYADQPSAVGNCRMMVK